MISFVRQDVFSSAAGTALSFTQGAAPTAGNILILSYDYPNTGQAITSIVQTGVTWNLAKRSNFAQDVEGWVGLVSAGASANMVVNITIDPGGAFTARLNVSEFSGVGATVISSSATNGVLSPTVVTGSLTPTAGSSRLFYANGRVGPSGASVLGSPSNSFIALSTGNGVNQFAYLIVSSAIGSYSTTWVGSGTPSWDAFIIELASNDGGLLSRRLTLCETGRRGVLFDGVISQ